jgi:CBS domain-containing protein
VAAVTGRGGGRYGGAVAGAVQDVMTARVVSVQADQPISAAVERLTRFGFSALPVITASDRLVGVVSLLDVLRHRELNGADADGRVADIMNPDVVSMAATANLAAVAQRMRSNGELRVLPIVKGGRLVGVITRSDLLRRRGNGDDGSRPRGWLRLLNGRRRADAEVDALAAMDRGRRTRPSAPATASVCEVMTCDVVTVGAADPVARAAELMLRHRHTALPVVDPDRRLQGIVSEADVLSTLPAGRSASGTVGAAMTRTAVTVTVDSTVGAARALVADRGLRTVPVIDGDRLVGVLSRSDLV